MACNSSPSVDTSVGCYSWTEPTLQTLHRVFFPREPDPLEKDLRCTATFLPNATTERQEVERRRSILESCAVSLPCKTACRKVMYYYRPVAGIEALHEVCASLRKSPEQSNTCPTKWSGEERSMLSSTLPNTFFTSPNPVHFSRRRILPVP